MKIKICKGRSTTQWECLGFSPGFDSNQLEGLQAPWTLRYQDLEGNFGDQLAYTPHCTDKETEDWKIKWFVQGNMATGCQSQYQSPRMTSHCPLLVLLFSLVDNLLSLFPHNGFESFWFSSVLLGGLSPAISLRCPHKLTSIKQFFIWGELLSLFKGNGKWKIVLSYLFSLGQ